MTTPNKLTLLRIAFIPIIVIIYYIPALQSQKIFLDVSYAMFIDAVLFVLASLTDALDGHLARKHNQITTFGKFADPLADKMLVFTAMLLFIDNKTLAPWIVIIIICREFMVSGIRLVASSAGKVIAASHLGKYKTATTMLGLVMYFFFDVNKGFGIACQVVIYVALALTVLSGIDYLYKNRKIIFESI